MTQWRRVAAISEALSLITVMTGCAASQADSSQVTKTVTCSYPVNGDAARPVDPPNGSRVAASGTVVYTLDMPAGQVVLTLDRSKAPCAVNSFASLAQQGYFDATKCHRLVDTGIFILQCGDPTGTGRGGPGYSFADELTGHETYPAGTVAMANAGTNTNGSQFFLVWEDSPLNPDYTVFGSMDADSTRVIAGIASQGVDGIDGVSPIADASITRVIAG